jgi:hypothetical protein
MSSLKTLVHNALVKYATVPREVYIAMVMADLFPESGVEAAVEVPVVEAVGEVPVVQAPAAPAVKLTKEEKAAAKAAKEAEKAAAAKAKEEAKVAKEAEKAAAKAAKEAGKPGPGSNLPKMDPTWRRELKKADKENAKALEPELLVFVNAMSNIAFNDRSYKEHVAEFVASRGGARPAAPAPAPVVPAVPVDLEVVEFQGKEFYVHRETKRVYEGVTDDESGELTITRPIGTVGMLDFADMVLEDE